EAGSRAGGARRGWRAAPPIGWVTTGRRPGEPGSPRRLLLTWLVPQHLWPQRRSHRWTRSGVADPPATRGIWAVRARGFWRAPFSPGLSLPEPSSPRPFSAGLSSLARLLLPP